MSASPRRRIDQWLSSLGHCSRAQARHWLAEGRVTVRGARVRDPAERVSAEELAIDGAAPEAPDGLWVLLHKPVGVVCSHDEGEGPRIYDLLPERWMRRNPAPASIGRLDKDSCGLVIVTDLTEWVHRLTSPKHKVEKLYRVELDGVPGPEVAQAFASGTLLLEEEREPCAPARLAPAAEGEAWEVTLTEGRFRQVRRMFAHFGLRVLSLRRERFGQWELGDLAPGAWRLLPLP